MRRYTLSLSVLVLGFLVFAGCASTDWEARYLEKENEARALQEQYDALNQSLAEREATAEELKGELDRTQESVEVLSSAISELRKQPAPRDPSVEENRRLRAELARLQAKYGRLAQLTPEGNIEITLNSDVTFAPGSYALTKNGKAILDSVAGELAGEFAGHMIHVIGHTDSDPIRKSPFKDNWELGAERALEVIRYFSSVHGIEPERLVAASRGENDPVTENTTKEGKKRNRRVEIVVIIPRREILENTDR